MSPIKRIPQFPYPKFTSIEESKKWGQRLVTALQENATLLISDIDNAIVSPAHNHAASEITSGTLVHERGGLEADVNAYNGLVKISGGATSAVTDASANWNTAFGWGDHGAGGYAASGGAEHDGFSDFVANEHIDWTNASGNFKTSGTFIVRDPYVDVRSYGAVGNGTDDDTTAIQAAIDAAATDYKAVFFPKGTYKITSTLTYGNYAHFVGDGYYSLIQGDLTAALLEPSSTGHDLKMDNIGLDNTDPTNSGGIGVHIEKSQRCKLNNVRIYNVETGVMFTYDATEGCYYNTLTHVQVYNCRDGFYFTDNANENRLIACLVQNASRYGARIGATSNVHLIALSVEGDFTTGIITISGTDTTQIICPRLERSTVGGTGVYIHSGASNCLILNPCYASLTTDLDDNSTSTIVIDKNKTKFSGGVFPSGMKSGTDQANAGAAAGELYSDTNDDNTVKIGV